MRSILLLAVISGLLLAGVLWIRPIIGEIGKPDKPVTVGRARNPQPAGTSPLYSGVNRGPGVSQPPPAGNHTSRPAQADAARVGITYLEKIEESLVKLTNEARIKEGGKPLIVDEMLRDAARGHSNDMLYRGFFDHIDPDGLNQAGRIAIYHRRLISRSTGENILTMSGYDPSNPEKIAYEMMYGDKGWMNSPGHKKNILDTDYTHIGIGVSQQGKEIRATQNFAQAKAYTQQPLPYQINSGGSLDLAAESTDKLRAEKYDFWSSVQGMKVGETREISDRAMAIAPGTYKLRFYFPTQGGEGLTPYWGPQIEVR